MELEDKSMEIYCNLYYDKTLLNDKNRVFSQNEKLGQISQPLLVGDAIFTWI